MAAILLGVLASCGQAESQRLANPAPAESPGATIPTTDEYVRRAGTADLFEVQAGNLALQKSGREDIRALARMIVDDHTRAAEALREAAGKSLGTATPPARLDSTHQGKLKQLQSANGPEFDRLYIEQQMQGHKDALALHRSYAAGGENAALKVAAGELALLVERHLAEVERISGSRSAPPPRG
jgi:putative membrane protein